MKNSKTTIWENNFSDNFRPNLLEKIVKKLEVSRSVVISGLLPEKGGVLIDIACGSGATLISVSNRFDKVIGFDIAKKRIESAKEGVKALQLNNIEFLNHDLDKSLPLKDNTVDYAICEASLSYFYDLSFVFSEIGRVLKKSGKFIIEVPNFAFITRRLALILGRMPKTSSFPGWQDGGALHYFTHASLKEMVEANGFEIESRTNSGVFPETRKIWPELLAGDIIYVCKKQK